MHFFVQRKSRFVLVGLSYKFSVEIIPYVVTWDSIVPKYHKTYAKRLQIPKNIEAYIQSIALKMTVETISFDRRRRLDWERASLNNEEDCVKTENTKNKEPTINANKELESEEEIEVVEMI
ncbi:hypothetical protein CWI38_1133p0020 [Hamiltosporidium tvaerminnensis]|uniref:Uncharacterized protein n=1 Tax=Hamiltosporidium tvaerminnensis TaxID=1176355 RepID=A0A4Q9LVE0_9MICR|nr:hypothetical protein CWI38_1133p0020 [Hamiltosporidium tvaerminnensis]